MIQKLNQEEKMLEHIKCCYDDGATWMIVIGVDIEMWLLGAFCNIDAFCYIELLFHMLFMCEESYDLIWFCCVWKMVETTEGRSVY